MEIINWGKYKFAAGVYWQPYSSRKELLNLAKEVSAYLKVELKSSDTTRPNLAGFIAKDELPKSGKIYSLGATVYNFVSSQMNFLAKDLNAESVIAILQVTEDKYVLLIICEGVIVKEIIGNKLLIKDEFEAALSLFQNAIKFVPNDEWSANAHSISFADLSEIKFKKHLFKKVSIDTKDFLTIGVAIGFIAISYFGFNSWQSSQNKSVEFQGFNQSDQLESQEIIIPWEGKPKADAVWAACKNTFQNNLADSPFGWKMVAIGCSPAGATASWQREKGFVEDLLSKYSDAAVDLDGNKAVKNIIHEVYANKSIYTDLSSLLDKKELITYLNNQSQKYRFRLSMQAKPGAELPGQDINKPESYSIIEFEITTTLLPIEKVLSMLPEHGVVISSFKSSSIHSSEGWQIKGDIYVKS